MKKLIISIIILFSILCLNTKVYARYVLQNSFSVNLKIDNQKPCCEIMYSEVDMTQEPIKVTLNFDEPVICNEQWSQISETVCEKIFEENISTYYEFSDLYGNITNVNIEIENIVPQEKNYDCNVTCFTINNPIYYNSIYLNASDIIQLTLSPVNCETTELIQILNITAFLDTKIIYPLVNMENQNRNIVVTLQNIEGTGRLFIQLENGITMDIIKTIETNCFFNSNLEIVTFETDELTGYTTIESNNFLVNEDLLYIVDGEIIEIDYSNLVFDSDSYMFLIETSKLEGLVLEDIYGNVKDVTSLMTSNQDMEEIEDIEDKTDNEINIV